MKTITPVITMKKTLQILFRIMLALPLLLTVGWQQRLSGLRFCPTRLLIHSLSESIFLTPMAIFSMPALFTSTSCTTPLLNKNIRLVFQERFPSKLRLSPSVIEALSPTTAKDFPTLPLLDIHLFIDRKNPTPPRLFLSLSQFFFNLILTT